MPASESRGRTSRPWVVTLAEGLGITLLYVAAARLGFSAAFVAEQVSPVWPPTGFALWAGLWYGRRIWPFIWLGAFVANAMTSVPALPAAIIATGNTLEAVAGVWLLVRVAGVDRTLDGLRHVTTLLIGAATVSTAISATIGVVTLCAFGLQPWSRFGLLWWIWWLGDATGDLLAAPVLLTLPLLARARPSPRRIAEAAALAALAVTFSVLVFVAPISSLGRQHPLEIVVFPLVIWAGLRFAHPGAALVSALVSVLAIWGTLQGEGPFGTDAAQERVILLQIYLGVIATSGLVLGAAIADRQRAERLRRTDHAITAILSEESSLEAAAPRILRAVGETLDWDVGILWRAREDGVALEYVDGWTRDPSLAGFTAHSRARSFPPGIGLPGRVWASGRPEAIYDVVVDANFPRAPAAAAAGLHGGFAFPILFGHRARGVMEFFARAPRVADEALLSLMAAAGLQIGQFLDRSELLAREQAAREQAEEANRSKDQFLSTVSHELRTPLTAILGWASMLRDGQVEPGQLPGVYASMLRNAEIQAQIVEDLLDVSRMVSGQLRLVLEPTDVGAVARASLDTIRPAALAKKVSLVAAIAEPPAVVAGDAARLQQVIWNLLSNAVKFTPAGGRVTLTAGVDGGQVVIAVADTGIGIAADDLRQVFDRFWQAEGGRSLVVGGLGLGLAIARHIVELHGGEIHASSGGAGAGSTFTVRLPVLDSAAAGPAAAAVTEA